MSRDEEPREGSWQKVEQKSKQLLNSFSRVGWRWQGRHEEIHGLFFLLLHAKEMFTSLQSSSTVTLQNLIYQL